jgi:uncharacterized protein (DUF4415 family)
MTAKNKRVGRRRIDLRASSEETTQIREDMIKGYYKPLKKAVTLRLDADIVAWFKKQGPRYQTRINRALRKLMIEGASGR